MKKIATAICLLGILASASSAFAAFNSQDMAKAPFVKYKGYTTEMSKMVDLVRYNHSSGNADVYYNLDPYAQCENKSCVWYTTAKRWLDPGQDDNLFGRHEIVFTNSWFPMSPTFTGKDKPVYKTPISLESYDVTDNL